MKATYPALMTMVFMGVHSALAAQSPEVALPPSDQSFWQTLVMIGIAFLFFYVILWRPEQKRRKALEEQRGALKKGDRVVAAGIIGTVMRVGEHTVILKMYDGAKLEFYKAAITDILPEADEGSKKASENNQKVEAMPNEHGSSH